MKNCPRCGIDKEDHEYYKYNDRLFTYCKRCAIDKYSEDDVAQTRHIFRAMWLKRYKYMVRRVQGHQWGPYRSNAKGKEILPKQDFLDWCQRPENLRKWKRLHKAYVASEYDPAKVVSIDRIDNDGGYTIGNMQWLTVAANAKKGNK